MYFIQEYLIIDLKHLESSADKCFHNKELNNLMVLKEFIDINLQIII